MKISYSYPGMRLAIRGLFYSVSNLIFKKVHYNFIIGKVSDLATNGRNKLTTKSRSSIIVVFIGCSVHSDRFLSWSYGSGSFNLSRFLERLLPQLPIFTMFWSRQLKIIISQPVIIKININSPRSNQNQSGDVWWYLDHINYTTALGVFICC